MTSDYLNQQILEELQAIRKLLEEIDKNLNAIVMKTSHQFIPDRMNSFDRLRVFSD